MTQQIKTINLKDLVLWTENPRDSIDVNATDQDVIDRALHEKSTKWKLKKLAKSMGNRYDFSELPTVVRCGDKYVVYDGNRRVALGKIKHKLVDADKFDANIIPDFPEEIPCNVCSKEIALDNVWRKHADTGSWGPLERDIFLHKHREEKKSIFLLLDENTGIVSNNPHLNQRFVKEEIFKDEILEKMGFLIKNGKLCSKHTLDEAKILLDDISRKIADKEITTRKNRGKIIDVMDSNSREIIDKNKSNKPTDLPVFSLNGGASNNSSSPNGDASNNSFPPNGDASNNPSSRRSRRTSEKTMQLFGGPLRLCAGNVNDLYRDIDDLYKFYSENIGKFSAGFPVIIRMALRLLCESAAKDRGKKIGEYVIENFENAKSTLDKNHKTTLVSQNITKESLVQLLHTGAHNYDASKNFEQTLAVSIIVGAILAQSHGKGQEK